MTAKKCKHGQWNWEACGDCHEEELAKHCACEFEGNDVPRTQVRWCSLHEEMRKRLEALEGE